MLKKSFLFNLLLVTLVIVGLLFLFFKSLNWMTNHGKETKVPNLTGKNMNDAIKILKKDGFTIQIDSTYQSYKNPLEVVYQEPEVGAVVKVGRTIFLTVNRKSVPTVPMPNLVNLSFRNALLTMQSYRLVMGDTTYRPDLAAGSVLEMWCSGKQLRQGMPIPYGSRIDLVIGEGLSDMQDVPNLIGMPWFQAKDTIESLMLSYNILWDGTITDSMNAVIYKQVPEALNELDFQNSILAGDIIEVRIMQNPTAEILEANKPGSAKFLGTSDEEDSIAAAKKLKDSIAANKRTKIPGLSTPTPKKGIENINTKKDDKDVKGTSTTPKKVVPKNQPASDSKVKKEPIKKSNQGYSNEYE